MNRCLSIITEAVNFVADLMSQIVEYFLIFQCYNLKTTDYNYQKDNKNEPILSSENFFLVNSFIIKIEPNKGCQIIIFYELIHFQFSKLLHIFAMSVFLTMTFDLTTFQTLESKMRFNLKPQP